MNIHNLITLLVFYQVFYDHYLRGEPADVALTTAQRYIKDRGAPVEHWAAYFAMIQMIRDK